MLRIEATPFDFEGLIHSVKTLFKPKADEKRLTFDVKIAPQIPQNLIGDPMRVSQIIVNLLGNAFKFTERGYVALTAELFDENTDFVTVKITVKDTGIGFNNEELPRIFQRFQQAKDDTTRLYGGSGLGLAIVKNLAEAMGGFVEADSKIGYGSTFSVILPFKKGKKECQISNVIARHEATKCQDNTLAKTPNSELKQNDLKPSKVIAMPPPLQTLNVKRQTSSPPLQTANGKRQMLSSRILVVEDNPMNQRLAALLLSDWGYDHDIVEDGQQAVNKLQTADYQLVLMDIQLPVMDGYTATTIIRNDLKSTVPIIATTAHAFSNEREKCFAAGMNDYVPKPLQEDEVLKVIQKYIKTESLQNEK